MEQLSQLLDAVQSNLNNSASYRVYLATIFHHKADNPNEEDYHYIELDEPLLKLSSFLIKNGV